MSVFADLCILKNFEDSWAVGWRAGRSIVGETLTHAYRELA